MYSFTGNEYIEKAVENYSDAMLNAAYSILKSTADAEDVVQEAFLKYIRKKPVFNSDEHEKAWLIRVATNCSRNMLKKKSRYSDMSMQSVAADRFDEETAFVFDALVSIPEKFSVVIVLHYIEGYKVDEIAGMIGKTPSAVKMRLQKGRKLLEKAYGEE